jgi:hypothetical protein
VTQKTLQTAYVFLTKQRELNKWQQNTSILVTKQTFSMTERYTTWLHWGKEQKIDTTCIKPVTLKH